MGVIFGNIPGVIIFPDYNFVYVAPVFRITVWVRIQVALAHVSALCQTLLLWPFVLQVPDVRQLCSGSDLSSWGLEHGLQHTRCTTNAVWMCSSLHRATLNVQLV